MQITADKRDSIRNEFGPKVTIRFLPDNGAPKMYCNPGTCTVVFNLHAIDDDRELSQLVKQAKGHLGIK